MFSRVVTSTVVVGPTGNPNAPAVYGLKVRLCIEQTLTLNPKAYEGGLGKLLTVSLGALTKVKYCSIHSGLER